MLDNENGSFGFIQFLLSGVRISSWFKANDAESGGQITLFRVLSVIIFIVYFFVVYFLIDPENLITCNAFCTPQCKLANFVNKQ